MNATGPSDRQSKVRVLIVDDDQDILESLRDVLELEDDYEVATAADAVAAKQAVRDCSPEIALIDIKLGQDNGLDLIPVLKRAIPSMVCIVMTALRDVEFAVKAVRTGADDYLFKPLEPLGLLKTLQRYQFRQRLEQEKSALQRRYRAVFDQAFQSLFLLEPDGSVIEANATALRLTATTHVQITGTRFWDGNWWGPSKDQRKRIHEATAAAAAGRSVRLEVDVQGPPQDPQDPKDTHYRLDLSLKPVQGAEGEADLLLCEGRDITARRRVELQLEEANDTLEQRVRERTGELELTNRRLQIETATRKRHEEELKIARDEAQSASNAKSDFLSRVSHELLTPMNAILGCGQLLRLRDLDGTQDKYVQEILTAGGHLLDLVNDILDLTRLKSGQLDPRMEEIALGQVVGECLGLIGFMAEQRRVGLTDHIGPGDEYLVHADRTRLKQALLNLLSNAVIYNRDEGEVYLTCDVIPGGRLRLSVRDTGPGISTEQQERLFEPFTREGRQSQGGGVGIGLTITKQLIESMEGRLGVDSTPGEGSTFWLELALAG